MVDKKIEATAEVEVDQELLARFDALAEEMKELRKQVEKGPELASDAAEHITHVLEEVGERVTELWNRGVEKVTDSEPKISPATAALAFGAGLLIGALTRRR